MKQLYTNAQIAKMIRDAAPDTAARTKEEWIADGYFIPLWVGMRPCRVQPALEKMLADGQIERVRIALLREDGSTLPLDGYKVVPDGTPK